MCGPLSWFDYVQLASCWIDRPELSTHGFIYSRIYHLVGTMPELVWHWLVVCWRQYVCVSILIGSPRAKHVEKACGAAIPSALDETGSTWMGVAGRIGVATNRVIVWVGLDRHCAFVGRSFMLWNISVLANESVNKIVYNIYYLWRRTHNYPQNTEYEPSYCCPACETVEDAYGLLDAEVSCIFSF